MGTIDQASRLRQLMQQDSPRDGRGREMAASIAVTGGKGGVGKTNVTANLAIALAMLGRRVAVLDADYALANIDVLLGFSPRFTIENVLSGERGIGEIIVEGPGGVKVIPAASGLQHLAQLTPEQQNKLFNALQVMEKHFHHMLIDTAAGISDNVMNILHSAADVLVVTNPEPPAFVDSYALIKHLLSEQKDARVKLIVNSVRDEDEAMDVYERISTTLFRFQRVRIEYFGYVVDDDNVRKAVRRQRPFVLQYPNSPASRCISALARKLYASAEDGRGGAGFWERLMKVLGRAAAG
jgi:flagellar biosynthesis protein FlhG